MKSSNANSVFVRLRGAKWALPNLELLAKAARAKADAAQNRVNDCRAEIRECEEEIARGTR